MFSFFAFTAHLLDIVMRFYDYTFSNIALILMYFKLLTTVEGLLFPGLTHSLTAALDQLRIVASSTSNDPGPRSGQHQQIGQCLLHLKTFLFAASLTELR